MKNRTIFCLCLFIFLTVTLIPQEKKAYTLSEIIDIGLKNNITLSALSQEIDARKASYQAAKQLFNPELELNAGNAKSYDGEEQRNTRGITLNQTLENPFKRHYRIEVQKNEWQAADYFYHYSQLDIIFQIKIQFYRYLYLRQSQQIAQKNQKSIQEMHQLIQKRAQLGEVKELEAIKLYVESLQAQKELAQTRTEIRLVQEKLNNLVSNSLPSDFTIIGEFKYIPFSQQDEGVLSQALVSHPLLKEKEVRLEQAENQLSFIKWQRFPDFKLSGFSQRELDGIDRGFGISFDIPLWNFKSKEIAGAESLSLKQQDEIKALRMDLTTEIRSRLSQVKLADQTIALFQSGLLKQAEESLKISEVSYREGEISLLDFLDSQRTYYSILRDYQAALLTWSSELAALEKAIGEELQ